MDTINFHYAYQLCDIASRENKPRITGSDRTLLSKKCFKSFVNSLTFCIDKLPNSFHTVCIFNDRSTPDLVNFVKTIIAKTKHIKFIFVDNIEKGICHSIKQCYHWLQENGIDFVYQVQDDYLFYESAIFELYQVSNQLKTETNSEIIASPFNDFWLWLAVYRNACTPRTVIVGENRYWIQYYDMSCSYMTTHKQFSQHWDLYHAFFDLLESNSKDLENYSLNFMLTQRGVLGLIPINNLAFHLQTELEEDPHLDWKKLWDSFDVTS